MAQKIYADYFLAFFTRSVSGSAEVWRLYTHDEGYNALSSSAGTVQISGDLYKTPGLKDICSTYYPLIGPYDTTDPAVAEYHVLLAKAAGIDGFMGEWAYEGMNRDMALLNLAAAAELYELEIGVNWCEYGHFAWQSFGDRQESMEAAKKGLLHQLRNVYDRCGAKVDGRPLLILFDARGEEAASPSDCFFGPSDIDALREYARLNGYDPIFLTRNVNEKLIGVADGFFKWVQTSGSPLDPSEQWTMKGDRELQIRELSRFYESCRELKQAGKIEYYLGGLWPGFDDHKGQAWGSGQKRYIPRDGGRTLSEGWEELSRSGAEMAMIVTWNDWEEASQIEPSLEFGYADMEECARRIAVWKQQEPQPELLRLPERLYRLRQLTFQLEKSGCPAEVLWNWIAELNQIGLEIAKRDAVAAIERLDHTEHAIGLLFRRVRSEPVHLLWEFSLPPVGLEPILFGNAGKIEIDTVAGLRLDPDSPMLGIRIEGRARASLQAGFFTGKISLEYEDNGRDFIRIEADANDASRQTIASFQKRNTGKWCSATLDLVNARFIGGLAGADIRIRQARSETGLSLRLVRIDGVIQRYIAI